MSKIIKRLLIFFVATFVFLSALIAIVFRGAFAQQFVVKYINSNYLNKNGIDLKIKNISYSLILRTIHLEGVQIDDQEHPERHSPLLTSEDVNFKLNVLSSYLSHKIVFDRIELSGSNLMMEYDNKGNLILPNVLVPKETNTSSTAKPFTALTNYMGDIPSALSLLNAHVEFGLKESKDYQDISITELKLTKHKKLFENKHSIEIKTVLKNSHFVFPSLDVPINLDSLDAKGMLYEDGKLELKSFNVKSNMVDFDSNLSVLLKEPLLLSQYKWNINNSDIVSEKFFELFGLPATGNIQLIGSIKSTAISSAPEILGKVKWQKLSLDDFNLFNGQGNIKFQNKILYYDHTTITTPLGGKLISSGQYQFFDSFYFENVATIQSLSLKELLDSVHAKQDVIDATLNAKKVTISGHLRKTITATQHEKYDVLIDGSPDVTNLHLIPLLADKRKPLPHMSVDLQIYISDKGLNFDHTIAHIPDDTPEGSITVTKSLLNTKKRPATMYMGLVGNNINISFLEYFITKKTTGMLNFTGMLTYNDKNPGIHFKSEIHAINGSIDHIPFINANGNFKLSDDHGELSNLIFDIPQNPVVPSQQLASTSESALIPPQNTSLNLSYLSFRYKDMYSIIKAQIQGNLGSVLHGLNNHIPKIFREFNGTINSLNFTMSGFLTHTSSWKFTFNTEIQPLITPHGRLSQLSMNLECAAEECTKSKILLNGFENKEASSALIVLYDVSFQKANLAFQFQNVPIEFFNYTSEHVKGDVYGLGELQGTWKAPEGNIELNIDHTEINEKDIGQVRVWYESDEPSNPQFNLAAFDNQFTIAMRIPLENHSKNSVINFRFADFDIGRLFPPISRWNENIYSRLNAHFSMEGKWDPNFRNGFSFLKNWQGSGKIEPSELQINSANLSLNSPNTVVFQNGILTFEKMSIASDFASILLDGNYDFVTTKIFLESTIRANLNTLNKVFYAVTDSEGKINGEFRITGTLHHPTFSGHMAISAKTLTLRTDTPSFTDIDGYISLNDTTIEIQKLNAKKGSGSINLTGTFDFKNLEENNVIYPMSNLHLVTRNTPFKIPIPIFRTLDLTVNSDLTLSGQKPPFQVRGQVEIQKLSIFRDLNCSEILAEYNNLPKTEADMSATPLANLNINVQALNSISIQSNCLRGHFSTTDNMEIVGNTNTPLLDGGLQTENAIFSLLKARFNVKKASFIFSEGYKFDPVVDISMNARVASYDIYWDVNGRLSVARLNLTPQPLYLPNGNPVSTAAILFMITTGQIPTQNTVNTLLAAAPGVYSYFGANNNFSSVINQTLSTVTGGLFDTLDVTPLAQNGEVSVRFTASRYFSQRLTFGVSFEGGQSVSSSSAFFYYLLNRHVGFTGAYSRSNIATQTSSSINDISGGLRFNFGSY